MEAYFGKRYKLETSQNFDKLMKALGVSFFTRTAGALAYPVVELTKQKDKDGLYVLTTTSTFKNQILKFKPGVEFDEITPDDRQVKSTITFEGNKMTHIQKGDKIVKVIREFGPKEMKAIMTVDDIVCTRTYKLQDD